LILAPARPGRKHAGFVTAACANLKTNSYPFLLWTVRHDRDSFINGKNTPLKNRYPGGTAMNAMIFSPHPDDDIIGCGGTIAAHVRQGDQVTVVYLTSGEAGSLSAPQSDLGAQREEEARQAAQCLGVHDLIFLRCRDGYLGFSAELLKSLVRLIREKKPEIVYLPHRRELPRDHRITHELCEESVRRAGGPWFQDCGATPWNVNHVLAYEIWTPLTSPNFHRDITPWFDLKMEALRRHTSQLAAIPYDEAVACLNRYRGILSGKGDYCESFQIVVWNSSPKTNI
jgi:LmbE family N-acetylglucosaminyl deacetylase